MTAANHRHAHRPPRTPGADGDGSADSLSLSEAEQVVEALSEAIALEAEPAEKARHLLLRFQQMLGGDADVELLLERDLKRPQGPLIVERVTVGPTFDRIEPRPHSAVQAVVEASEPILRQVLPYVLENPRTPQTLDPRRIPEPGWFRQLQERFLFPLGFENFLLGSWAASDDRLVMLVLPQRREQPPWGADAQRLLSLMLRAVAPIVDREMFDSFEGDGTRERPAAGAEDEAAGEPLAGKDLSGRQTDVLHLLLRGMSEKEAARELGVSTHTVHTHVKKLYHQFGVSSRGELLARFVDQRVLKQTG